MQALRRRDGEWTQIYGENGAGSFGPPDAQNIVDRWASELANYDYDTNTCTGVCGHYTQIVWATSLRLGCGSANCSNNYVVYCNYGPPGNYVGRSPY